MPGSSLFDPPVPISRSTLVNHRDQTEGAETHNEGLCILKSQQYRARPIKHRELVKSSTRAGESRKFKTWRALSASDERGFAKEDDDPLQFVEQDPSREATLAAEEQRVLRISALPNRAMEQHANNAATRSSIPPGPSETSWRR